MEARQGRPGLPGLGAEHESPARRDRPHSPETHVEEDTGGHGKREDMKRENFDHGFAEEAWEAAKAEACQAMIAVAARRRVIAYSDLVAEIRSLDLEPQSDHLAHMLGEISTAEYEAGRGMLTVVVVHKHGDQMPGPGFFQLAPTLGHDRRDGEAFWIG